MIFWKMCNWQKGISLQKDLFPFTTTAWERDPLSIWKEEEQELYQIAQVIDCFIVQLIWEQSVPEALHSEFSLHSESQII